MRLLLLEEGARPASATGGEPKGPRGRHAACGPHARRGRAGPNVEARAGTQRVLNPAGGGAVTRLGRRRGRRRTG